jgi:hypothetical protein
MSKEFMFNGLKLMLGYKKLDSREFSLLLGGDYSSYQIGKICSKPFSDKFERISDDDIKDSMSVCGGGSNSNSSSSVGSSNSSKVKCGSNNKVKVKKGFISDTELKRFSEVLGINELLLSNDYSVGFDCDVLLNRLRSEPSMSGIVENYYISVCVICVSLLYRFLVDHYKFMKLDICGIKCCFNGHINNKYECIKFDNSDSEGKDGLCCKVSSINKEVLTSVILEYLGIGGRVINNLIGFLENKGFIFFSFKGCGWIRSFSVLHRVEKEDGIDESNGIIFLRDDLSELEIRECVLGEVVRIIIRICYGACVYVKASVIDEIVNSLILQDCWKEKVCGINLRCYSEVCRWMDVLRISGMSFLRRLNEFGIDCGNYFEMKKSGCDIDMFYKRVWSVNRDNGRGIDVSCKDNKVCRDKVLLWEKIKGMSYSYEYISNVTGLSMGMINEFCFGANKGFDSSVENHLRIV